MRAETSVEDRPRALTIGLTGGVASGKSAVADMFAYLGAVIIDTDEVARDVVRPGSPGLADVVAAFGVAVLNDHGALDRRRLRRKIFGDPDGRRRLEAILHPRIRAETLGRIAATPAGRYQIVVVPLLVETGFDAHVDRVLVVDTDEGTQIDRLMRRDNEPEDQARAVLDAQTTRDMRLAVADDVIDNSRDLSDTRTQVERLHARYTRLAQGAICRASKRGAE